MNVRARARACAQYRNMCAFMQVVWETRRCWSHKGREKRRCTMFCQHHQNPSPPWGREVGHPADCGLGLGVMQCWAASGFPVAANQSTRRNARGWRYPQGDSPTGETGGTPALHQKSAAMPISLKSGHDSGAGLTPLQLKKNATSAGGDHWTRMERGLSSPPPPARVWQRQLAPWP